MKRTVLVLMTALGAGTSSVALAHPGHGADGGNYSLIHLLTEVVHVVPLLGVVVLVALAIQYFRARLRGPRDAG